MAHTRKKMFYAPKAFNGYGPPEPPIPAAQDRPGRYPVPAVGRSPSRSRRRRQVAYICPVCWVGERRVHFLRQRAQRRKSWADPVPGAGKCPAVRHLRSPDEAVRASEEISSSGMPLGHLNRNPPILALFGVFWFPLWWSVSRIPGESAFSQLPPGQAGIVRKGAGFLRRPFYDVCVTE